MHNLTTTAPYQFHHCWMLQSRTKGSKPSSPYRLRNTITWPTILAANESHHVVSFLPTCPDFSPMEIREGGPKGEYRGEMEGDVQCILWHFHPNTVLDVAWACIQMHSWTHLQFQLEYSGVLGHCIFSFTSCQNWVWLHHFYRSPPSSCRMLLYCSFTSSFPD